MALFGNLFSKKQNSPNENLKKSGQSFFTKVNKIFAGRSTVDDDTLNKIEEVLITSDVGVKTTLKIIDHLEKRIAHDKYLSLKELYQMLKEEMVSLCMDVPTDTQDQATLPKEQRPYVIMVVGVNGTGKTTTIGKLAARFRRDKKSVLLGAADTFRAAAPEQLQQWGTRVDADVVVGKPNADPSSVAYETVKKGLEQHTDVVIIDTAGRLHTKTNLMNELGKINRVIQKVMPNKPNETLLVLDGSTGQNAIVQAREFANVTTLTGIVITKLEGTAKGGVIIGLSDELKIPIKYLGTGEQADDLENFCKETFIESLFCEDSHS